MLLTVMLKATVGSLLEMCVRDSIISIQGHIYLPVSEGRERQALFFSNGQE